MVILDSSKKGRWTLWNSQKSLASRFRVQDWRAATITTFRVAEIGFTKLRINDSVQAFQTELCREARWKTNAEGNWTVVGGLHGRHPMHAMRNVSERKTLPWMFAADSSWVPQVFLSLEDRKPFWQSFWGQMGGTTERGGKWHTWERVWYLGPPRPCRGSHPWFGPVSALRPICKSLVWLSRVCWRSRRFPVWRSRN